MNFEYGAPRQIVAQGPPPTSKSGPAHLHPPPRLFEILVPVTTLPRASA